MENSDYKNICNSPTQQETYKDRFNERMATLDEEKEDLRQQIRQQNIARRHQAEMEAKEKQETSNFLRGLAAFFGGMGQAAINHQPTQRTRPAPSVNFGNVQQKPIGTPVVDASQCIGSVANGRCLGQIRPSGGVQKKCYGTMSNGECVGFMGY